MRYVDTRVAAIYVTLNDFLTSRGRNEYVYYPGFRHLYLRKGIISVRTIAGMRWTGRAITLANMGAVKPGNGSMTKLIEELTRRGYHIFVECIQNPRLVDKLLRMDFVETEYNGCLKINDVPSDLRFLV